MHLLAETDGYTLTCMHMHNPPLPSKAVESGSGFPFGAALVRVLHHPDGRAGFRCELVRVAGNRVLAHCDPTAHAEIECLRASSRALQRRVLEDTVMFATGEPCPMCLGALMAARVPRVYVGVPREVTCQYGFPSGLREEVARPWHARQLVRYRCVEWSSMSFRCLMAMRLYPQLLRDGSGMHSWPCASPPEGRDDACPELVAADAHAVILRAYTTWQKMQMEQSGNDGSGTEGRDEEEGIEEEGKKNEQPRVPETRPRSCTMTDRYAAELLQRAFRRRRMITAIDEIST